MRKARAVPIALATLGVVACNQLFVIEEGKLIGVADGAAPPSACPADCVPKALVGWTGPVVLATSPEKSISGDYGAPNCPERYPVESLVAYYGELKAEPATCSPCISAATDEKCTSPVTAYSDSDCQTVAGTYSFSSSPKSKPCLQTASYGKSFRFGRPSESGTCPPAPPQKPTKPTPTWARSVRACGPQALAACTDAAACVGALAGASPFDRTCVFASGEQACPADYPTRFSGAFQGFDDQRSCEECEPLKYQGACGSYMGVSHAAADCSGNVGENNYIDLCFHADATGNPARAGLLLDGFAPYSSRCYAGTPKPTGAIVPKTPVSICCR